MSQHFLDTSGLVKHYHPEVGTPEVDRLWADPNARLFISRIGVVEAISVFAKKVRTGLISPADFGLLRRRFFADLRRRRLLLVRLLVRHFQEADRLLKQHGLTLGLHTLDALQLAVALDLRHRGMLDTFVTADRVLLAVAPLEGLPVFDPEHP
jgi:predicted nucleic acid-binding protein